MLEQPDNDEFPTSSDRVKGCATEPVVDAGDAIGFRLRKGMSHSRAPLDGYPLGTLLGTVPTGRLDGREAAADMKPMDIVDVVRENNTVFHIAVAWGCTMHGCKIEASSQSDPMTDDCRNLILMDRLMPSASALDLMTQAKAGGEAGEEAGVGVGAGAGAGAEAIKAQNQDT